MVSHIEELYFKTRNHPVCSYLIPLEAILSFPIPAIEQGQIVLKFFVYQRGWAPRGLAKSIFAPYSRLVIEYPSGRLVEYRELASETSEQPVGEFPHAAIAGRSVSEILAFQTDYFAATENLLPFLELPTLNPPQLEAVQKYKTVASLLLEPGLLPYYQELNPTFFAWLEQ